MFRLELTTERQAPVKAFEHLSDKPGLSAWNSRMIGKVESMQIGGTLCLDCFMTRNRIVIEHRGTEAFTDRQDDHGEFISPRSQPGQLDIP